jgi:ribosomal protein L11 methyltransferase
MSWIELCFHTTAEAVDWVKTSLDLIGYDDTVQIIPFSPFYERGDRPPWSFTIQLYLPNRRQTYTEIDKIEQQLSALRRTGQISELELHRIAEKPTPTVEVPLRIGQRFVVLDADTPDPPTTSTDIILRLPNTLAFGSGFHPATQLTLQLIERHVVPNQYALDLGTGSGILSVAMAKLGASVLAVDNDPIAIQATQAAVDLNQVPPQVNVSLGSLGQGNQLGHWLSKELPETAASSLMSKVTLVEQAAPFDLIVANILARVHVALAPDYRAVLRRTENHLGRLIAAGFTIDHIKEINAALTAVGFEAIDRAQAAEWVAIAYQLSD